MEAKECDLNHPTLTFYGEKILENLPIYEIKLKGTKFWQGDYDKSSKLVTVSYIADLNVFLSDRSGTVYLSLQDKDGFEITRKSLQRVVAKYTGNLKGNFSLSPEEYQKICGAELFFMVDVK